MSKHASRLFYTVFFSILSVVGNAQDVETGLNKNPFSQPESLKVQPQTRVIEPVVEAAPVATDFTLSATLISVNEPMAIVNGELLTMDEEIKGIRLIMVDEGRAVISYQGKKYDISIGNYDSLQATTTGLK